MAKVSLRIYNREIETLIDQGQIDEAIAHCQHILKVHPKYLEAYRLLGKAFLEARRFSDAADIFQRVIDSVPDDFVSHVGMSIIRDEENKLDEAIWHMERAFEAESSNAAVQGELQRLYGRRDGVEPPKIRMTRGALAHMYLKGELYPQAISEIRAVLAEDPDRADMQVLLAMSYFRSGQKAEASEICNQLLNQYPFCLDANRILVEILPGTGKNENTQVYRGRINSLEPYAIYATGSVFQIDQVADAAVSVDRLDYNPGEPVSSMPDFSSSIGSRIAPSGLPQVEPDWLHDTGEPAAEASTPAAAPSTPAPAAEPAADGEPIPEWMREAGWGESTGTAVEGPMDLSQDDTGSGEIASGDIPDWIKAMAPSESEPEQASPEDIAAASAALGAAGLGALGDDTGWMSGANAPSGAQAPAAGNEDTSAWLNSLGAAEPETPASQPAAGDTPDWLGSLGADQAAPPALPAEDGMPITGGDMPDWLGSPGTEESAAPAQPSDGGLPDWAGSSTADAAPETPAPASGDGGMPDWVSSLDKDEPLASAQPPADSGMPDWVSSLDKDEPLPPARQPADGGMPDWIGSNGAQETAPASPAPVPSAGTTSPASGDDDQGMSLPSWLVDSLGAEPTAPATPPASTPPASTPPAPAAPAASIGDLGKSAQEQDDAMLWLESLAAGQGAKPEELITDPNKRTEAAPEWVEQAKSVGGEQPPAAPPPPGPSIGDLGKSAQEQDDAMLWLESLAAGQGAKPEELITDPNKRTEAAPEWVEQAKSVGGEQPPAAPPPPGPSIGDLGKSAQEQDDAMLWLESLAAGQGAKPEELITDPSKRTEAAPEWVEQAKAAGTEPTAGQDDDWMKGLLDQPSATEPAAETAPNLDWATPQAAAPQEDDWMKGLEQPSATEPAAEAAPDLDWATPQAAAPQEDDWMKGLEQPSATEPAAEAAPDLDWATPQAAAPQEDDWMKGLEQPSATEPAAEAAPNLDWATPQATAPQEDDWMKGLEQPSATEPAAVEPAAEAAPAGEEASPDLSDWLKSLDEPAAPIGEDQTVPGQEAAAESLPDWLNGMEKPAATQPAPATTDDMPAWLRSETPSVPAAEVEDELGWADVDQPPVEGTPRTSPAEWKPEHIEEPPAAVTQPAATPPMPPQATTPVERKTPAPVSSTAQKDTVLVNAQSALQQGNIAKALGEYAFLIKKGRLLDEVIYDLREALYRFPVDVTIWQTLGDAYMRANRLQDALDSYTKAEELLR
jgi:tetratricopeptide (TPR) repeat protein